MPKRKSVFQPPTKEKLESLSIQPQVKMPDPPPPPELPTSPNFQAPVYLNSMPLPVKVLADNFMANPKAGLKTHAESVGMSLGEARKALRRSDVREYVNECLDAAGATVEASCKAIAEAVVAVRVVGSMPSPDDPKTKVLMHAPDHDIRLRAAELSLKLRGMLQQNSQAEEPMTLAKLIAAIHQERQRRALDVTPPK